MTALVSMEEKAQVLQETLDAFNKEALRFKSIWTSRPEDVLQMDMLTKATEWLTKRIEKCRDTLPRELFPDEWPTLSDGAMVAVNHKIYFYDSGHGVLRNSDGKLFDHSGTDSYRENHVKYIKDQVRLLDHNV